MLRDPGGFLFQKFITHILNEVQKRRLLSTRRAMVEHWIAVVRVNASYYMPAEAHDPTSVREACLTVAWQLVLIREAATTLWRLVFQILDEVP